MLKKKAKGVSGLPTGPSSSPYAFDEEARARFKYQSLMQDYDELQKETEARGRKLQMLDRRKLTLMAEVRFLRRRYNYLMKIRSPEAPSVSPDLARPQVPVTQRESLPKSKPFPNLDLNQISNGDEGEAEDFEFVPDPPKPKAEKHSKKYFLNGSHEQEQLQQPSDMKLSICRGIPNGSNRSGKRKITWQDQVALRV